MALAQLVDMIHRSPHYLVLVNASPGFRHPTGLRMSSNNVGRPLIAM